MCPASSSCRENVLRSERQSDSCAAQIQELIMRRRRLEPRQRPAQMGRDSPTLGIRHCRSHLERPLTARQERLFDDATLHEAIYPPPAESASMTESGSFAQK